MQFIRCLCAGSMAACLLSSAWGQVFLQLDGYGVGNTGANVTSANGPVTDSGNIHNMFFPQSGNDQASVAVANRGTGLGNISSISTNDGGMLRAYASADGFGNSGCEPSGCGNGTSSAGVTTRITFRVSSECVLYLRGNLRASTSIDVGGSGSASGSAMCNVVVTGPTGTLYGSQISNSTDSLTTRAILESGVARLFPNTDYAFTVNADGQGQSSGSNCSGYGSAWSDCFIRLFPPACPVVSTTADVVHCASLSGASAMFSATASGQAPLTLHWQAFLSGAWTNLTDGPVAGVGTVSNSGTTALTISGPGIVPNLFRITASNSCGTSISAAVALKICDSDFNCDGAVDFFDYLDFVEAFAGSDPMADFNHDSVIDFFDYLDFLDTFSVPC